MIKDEVFKKYAHKCDDLFCMMFFRTMTSDLTYKEYKEKHFNGDVSLMAKAIKESRPNGD